MKDELAILDEEANFIESSQLKVESSHRGKVFKQG
jgi:hypothetical protein